MLAGLSALITAYGRAQSIIGWGVCVTMFVFNLRALVWKGPWCEKEHR